MKKAETYSIYSGNLKWSGKAKTDDHAFKKAIRSMKGTAQLGLLIQFSKNDSPNFYISTESVLERLGMKIYRAAPDRP